MSPIVRDEAVAGKQKKLLEQIRDLMRLKHYSLRTERCYCDWIERFIRFHRMRHPSEMGEPEVTAFLTHLGAGGKCGGLDPESSFERAFVLVQRAAQAGDRLAQAGGAGQEAGPAPSGVDA